MKRQSRILAAILFVFAFTAILTLAALSVNADADAETASFEIVETEDHGSFTVYHIRFPEGTFRRPPMRSGRMNALGLSDTQMQTMKNGIRADAAEKKEIIGLQQYYIPYDIKKAELLVSAVGEDPENIGIRITGYYQYTLDNNTYFYGLAAEYYTDAEVAAMREAGDALLEGVAESGLSDAEKALIVHDRLAVWSEYDEENLEKGTVPENSYEAYGVLADHIGVCEGYAKAYMYLMNRLGIPTEYITSTALNHGWNVVTIDGQPYHVDVTHDDPVYDVLGRVWHSHFLVSTGTLRSFDDCHAEYDYDTENVISDTAYENELWRDVDAAYVLCGGEVYCLRADSTGAPALYRRTNGSEEAVLLLSDALSDTVWYANGGTAAWNGIFCRLQTDGETLYISLAKNIYRYEPDTGVLSVVCSPAELTAPDDSIYGFRLDGDTLRMQIGTGPNGRLPVISYAVPEPPEPPKPALPGDLNGDGVVNITDTVYLLTYLLYPEYAPLGSADADYNGDGSVDSYDAAYLLQYSVFPELYPIE